MLIWQKYLIYSAFLVFSQLKKRNKLEDKIRIAFLTDPSLYFRPPGAQWVPSAV